MNYKSLPNRVFQIIQYDLFDRTVKIPRTNKPLCTGGNRVDYRDFDEPVDVSANQEGAYDQPNFVIQLNLPSSEFPYNVEMGRGRSWGQLNDYLTQQYGLTQEECDRVWDEYRTTICKEPALPINESKGLWLYGVREDQIKYLNAVVNQLISETYVERITRFDQPKLYHPFPYKTLKNPIDEYQFFHRPQSYHFTLEKSIYYPYLKDTYGLTHNEIKYVFWQFVAKVQKMMKDHPLYGQAINESRGTILDESAANIITHPEDDEDPYSFAWHPEPKKRKFYEVVLRDVVNNSTIEPDGVISVGDTEVSHQRGLLFHNLSHAYDVGPFLKHLRDTYGLVRNETHPIWSRWEHIMGDKIKKWLTAKGIKLSDAGYEEPLWAQNDEEEINESTESNFLDKVVTHLLKDTKYDKDNDMVNSPALIDGRAIRSSFNFTIYHNFLWDLKDYLKKIYGLNEEEANEVWGKYQRKLRIYNVYDNAYSLRDDIISESIDKQQKVYDYTLQDLVNNTIINWGSDTVYPYQIIRFPFSIYPHEDSKKNRLEWVVVNRHMGLDISQFYKQFKSHARTMYGLTQDEIVDMFPEWETEVIEKIRVHSGNYPENINESTDKQEKYLQYIITTLLNETIIDKENEEVHLPWGMYVNVFSNFAAIDVDLHNPAKDLTGNIAENFWDMMEKTYGLRENEVERVWKIYGPTLSKKMHVAWFDDWIELMSRI